MNSPRKRLVLTIPVLLVMGLSMFAASPASSANPSANLDQCANDPLPSPSTDGCNSSASQWVNGNLGASKSVYFEGDSIAYRMRFDNLDTSKTHVVTIAWDTTKSFKHALDYITSFNQTVANANPCLGVSGCDPNVVNTEPILDDPHVTAGGVTEITPKDFYFYGGTIIGGTALYHLGTP